MSRLDFTRVISYPQWDKLEQDRLGLTNIEEVLQVMTSYFVWSHMI